MINRRNFLLGTAAFGTSCLFMPGMALANVQTDKRLIVVLMRGAMDGLAAVPPYQDKNYQSLRGPLAINSDALLKIDNGFALNPALKNLHGMYENNDLAILHAIASPYRQRSHFDAQNMLELGSNKPHALRSGWMNRLINRMGDQDGQLGIAIGQGIPQIFRGHTQVGSWQPSALPETSDDFIEIAAKMYENNDLFSRTLKEGLRVQSIAEDAMHGNNERKMARQLKGGKAFDTLCQVAGKMLARTDGPRLATLEIGGWDTHTNQGTEGGRLANTLGQLDRGLATLKTQLGPSWDKTVIIAMTEFGRTAAPNGNNGTDHGTASAAFVLGGAVKGGRILTKWPGLGKSSLFQGRDLMPTLDMYALLKGVLNEHLGISSTDLTHAIFPSSNATPLRGLIKT